MTAESPTGANKPRKEGREVADVYLVKVYRRGSHPEESLVGIVEEISGKKKGSFKTEEELLRWLGKGQAGKI